MGTTLQITLESNDVGQLLDGLRSRAEAWRKTAEYLEIGEPVDDYFICEECSNSTEAEAIANHYQSIIRQIEEQVRNQGG